MSSPFLERKLQTAYEKTLREWATQSYLQLGLSLTASVIVALVLFLKTGWGLPIVWLGIGVVCFAFVVHAGHALVLLWRQRQAGIQTELFTVEGVRLVRDRHRDEGPTVWLRVRDSTHVRLALRTTSRCPLKGVAKDGIASVHSKRSMDQPTTDKQRAWLGLAHRVVRVAHAKHLRIALAVELVK